MSKPSLVVEFTKMQAAGNDFIVIDNRFYYFSDDEQAHLARTWCDRHFGIGADGLIVLSTPQDDGSDVAMQHHNPDGGVATLCGNGTRCAALYALNAGMTQGPEVHIRSGAGIRVAHLKHAGTKAGRVSVVMPLPSEYQHIVVQEDTVNVPVAHVWTGTEHAVYERDDRVNFETFAPSLRRYEGLGERGSNVNEIEILSPGIAKMRTYEKGVEAETLACGTGAVAVAFYLSRFPNTPKSITLHAKGGVLHVHQRDNVWYLEGPATIVYRGTFEYEAHA